MRDLSQYVWAAEQQVAINKLSMLAFFISQKRISLQCTKGSNEPFTRKGRERPASKTEWKEGLDSDLSDQTSVFILIVIFLACLPFPPVEKLSM